ncbi:MAG TPA: FHA domain-containing protein [Gemmataceae bacterium]|nr:FHA domain-containing protein [Gemmataceae bacterium]
MSSHHDHEFDATKPALVLLHGAGGKKHRMLDRDVLVIGRARGCDFGLDAPDISNIHCIINNGPHGFRIRDCQSRAGTKLNGNALRESALHDGDTLQIGPFSFRVHLPANSVAIPTQTQNVRLQHIQHSRRNLAKIALRQRKMLMLQDLGKTPANGKASKAKLSQQVQTLKTRVREYDLRARGLEDAERELAKDREKLEHDMRAFDELTREHEQQMAKRRQEMEAGLQQRHRDLEALARQLQFREQHLQSREGASAEHLRASDALQQDLSRQQHALNHQLEAFERQKKEFSMKCDQWASDQASLLTRLGQQKMTLAQVEETLRGQRQDLDDVLAALQEGQALGEQAGNGELAALRDENDRLRQLVAARPQHSGSAEKEQILQRENEELRQLLAGMEQEREQPHVVVAGQQEAHAAELALLKALLAEKESVIQELSAKPAPVGGERDIDTYETELNNIQRQLEVDRHTLNKEIEQLRARNKELDEATREMELEMSRERAELARERQRVDRLRDDVRQEVERMQRDGGLRERLAPVNNLRDQINNRRQPANEPAARPSNEDVMQQRLKALRTRVNE